MTTDLVPCGKKACAHLVESLLSIKSPQEKSMRDLDYVIKTFPNILIDIVHIVIKQATDNAREFSSHCQDADANIQQLKPFFVLGWLIGKSPQISNVIYNYFENSSFQPLPEELFLHTSIKERDVAYTYPGFDDELVKNILETYFKYLTFNPKWFGSVWNWSELGRLMSLHPNNDINYLAGCCLSIITRPTRHQHMMFLQDLMRNPSLLIHQQLKHAQIFRHKSRPLIETRPERASQFIESVGKSESGRYEFNPESVSKIANALLPRRDISLESNHMKKTIEKTISRFVPVPSLCDALSRIAYASSIDKPCLIRGPTGSGKTSILDYIAAHTNRVRPPDYIKVQVGDQIDSKSLIGSYVCTEIPGQFEWQAGPLTQGLAYGAWVVFEDIDSAPSEIAQVIHSVIENGNLSCVSSCPIKMDNPHPDFKIFFTQRTKSYNNQEALKLGFGFVERLCDIVDMPELSDTDLKEIIEKRYQFGQIKDTILQLFHTAQKFMLEANLTRQTRSLSLTDLFKLCDRISKREMKESDGVYASSDLDGLLLDSIDCYLASLPTDQRADPARLLGQILNKPPCHTDSILLRKPDIRSDGRFYTVGRASLEGYKSQDKPDSTIETRSSLAHTRQSLQLMESVALCINNRESVLLVGETGVGKTTIVQHLANLMNTELTVINLSQQSDSSDLLGGVRPIEMREIIKPIHDEFVDLFNLTYDIEKNEEFLRKAETLFVTGRKPAEWLTYLKLNSTLCSKALKHPLTPDRHKRWNNLSMRVRRLRKRLSEENSSPMALSFTESFYKSKT